MTDRLKLLCIILAIPLIGFAVSEGITAHFNSELRNLNIMRQCALLAIVIGVCLLFIIKAAGFIARTNRLVLLYLFRPGLYFVIVVLITLIALNAIVAIGIIYYGESILIHKVHIFLIFAIGIGALAGIGTMAKSAFATVRKARTLVVGKSISKSNAPQLWDYINSIAKKIGGLSPEHIVVGLDANFFVTEADVVCLDGELSGRTLYCSLPLCRILSPDELTAIIGMNLGILKA